MNILSCNDKDRFGFYYVDGFKTYSKVEAVEYADRVKKMVRWNFNDEVFSAHDWSIEPACSLEDLYAKRAREIRDKYDYVVIFYSGGIDSQNIVDTFVKNDLKIDELATMNYYGVDPDPDAHFHAEHTYVTYPRIRALQDQGIEFRHRSIDLSEFSYSILTDRRWNLDRAYHGNTHASTMHVAKTYIREKTPDYMKLIEQGKKLVFVWGADKPRVKLQGGKYMMEFCDYVGSAIGTRTQIENRDWEHDELFYWDPSCCDLICKQAHMIKKFAESLPEPSKKNFISRSLSEDIIDDETLSSILHANGIKGPQIYRNIVNWLIYPNFRFDMFSTGKPPSTLYNVYSPRDAAWFNDPVLRKQTDLLAQHYQGIGRHWLRDPDVPHGGIKNFFTRFEISTDT